MKKVGVAILGLSGAGGGAYKILEANDAFYRVTQGIEICVESVLEPDLDCIAALGIPEERIASSIAEIVSNPDVNIVVESIEDTAAARDFVLSALNAGKTVVLSNPELVCKYSNELERTAKRTNAGLFIEASCMGGVPIVRTLLDGLQASRLTSIMGVVSDLATDPDGYHAAYKLSILASLAFHTQIPFEKVVREGSAQVSSEEIRRGAALGYDLKVVAVGKNTASGIEVRVHPALVKRSHPLAAVTGNEKVVQLKGDAVGDIVLYGKGECSHSAGNAVVSDIVYAATHSENRYFFKNAEKANPNANFSDDFTSAYYLRLTAADKTGVLAKIASVFGKCGVSVGEVNECETVDGKTTVVFITHETHESTVKTVVQKLCDAGIAEVNSVLRVIS